MNEDGLARYYGVYPCCNTCNFTSEGSIYPWEPDGDRAVIIWEQGVGAANYIRAEYVDCDTISMAFVSGGMETGVQELHRGELCLQDNGANCEGVECDACETVWCDGSPPPACE